LLFPALIGGAFLLLACDGGDGPSNPRDGGSNDEYNAFTDKRDGNVYRVVEVDGRMWMAENLRYRDVKADPILEDNSWCASGDKKKCEKEGFLYSWAAVMLDSSCAESKCDVVYPHRGICPEGWHVPTSAEMKTLYSGLRKKLKALKDSVVEGVGTSLKKKEGWEESDEAPPGTDRFGFGAVPGGYRNSNGVFNYLGQDCNFWVASEASEAGRAPYWNLYFANEDFLGVYNNLKSSGYSLRCVKNAE
jgi:uncharacterized protein (TIGR02145 family)